MPHERLRKTEKELFEVNQRLQALMNALPVGVDYSDDVTCERITGNPALLKQLGLPPGANMSATTSDMNAAGRKFRHFNNGVELKPSELPMQRAIAENREIKAMEIDLVLPDGKHWIHEASAAPVRDSEGNVIGAVAVNVDLTERKKLESILEERKRFESEKLKSSFIADATHELRTPLAIIKGNIDLAFQSKSRNITNAYDALKAINEEVTHLSNLLSDLTILTSDKTEELERKIISHNINLSQLIIRVVGRCKTLARKNNITINTKMTPNIHVWGDRIYLEKLFMNIITNAILYSKKRGKVSVYDNREGDRVNISIKDNGIGIPEQDLDKIFDRFYRSSEARATNHSGTGLGLAISKWIVDLHGGKLDVSSVEGQGSIFTICLPVLN